MYNILYNCIRPTASKAFCNELNLLGCRVTAAAPPDHVEAPPTQAGEPSSAIDPNIRSARMRAICDRFKIHILFLRAYA